MNNKCKIAVVGLGYVGLSNAALLAQQNDVFGIDISEERINALKAKVLPFQDDEMENLMEHGDLSLSFTNRLDFVKECDFAIVCTPTDYNPQIDYFDTSVVESVINQVNKLNSRVCIIIKSTIPIGFVDRMREELCTKNIIFSPEFLREGRALYDNFYPSRIIIGDNSEYAEKFALLLQSAAKKREVPIIYTGTKEAEAIKLFSNTYLAMRVSFFNELDTFAQSNDLSTKSIISGVSSDPRIGDDYNNPSFGYGGYCLPKDTKQLLSNYKDIPQNLISAIIESNTTRKKFIASVIKKNNPQIVGAYRLNMKTSSDNFRESAIHDIINILHEENMRIIIYEPTIEESEFNNFKVERSITDFKSQADIIITNRLDQNLEDVLAKVFTCDVFGKD